MPFRNRDLAASASLAIQSEGPIRLRSIGQKQQDCPAAGRDCLENDLQDPLPERFQRASGWQAARNAEQNREVVRSPQWRLIRGETGLGVQVRGILRPEFTYGVRPRLTLA